MCGLQVYTRLQPTLFVSSAKQLHFKVFGMCNLGTWTLWEQGALMNTVDGRNPAPVDMVNITLPSRVSCSLRKKNYFTSSDPHHDMLGGGCQVRVVIKNMMGRMENLRTLVSGFLGLVILVRWALVTMFLSWTTQTGCRIHRTYVSLIGSGEGRHTTSPEMCSVTLNFAD